MDRNQGPTTEGELTLGSRQYVYNALCAMCLASKCRQYLSLNWNVTRKAKCSGAASHFFHPPS